jgi:hypothetical protein
MDVPLLPLESPVYGFVSKKNQKLYYYNLKYCEFLKLKLEVIKEIYSIPNVSYT